MKRWLLLQLFIFPFIIQAQKIPLINSGEVIQKSLALRDSSKYEDAINLLLTIPKRDTNYLYMLSELAPLYSFNKQYDKAIATAEDVLLRTTEYTSNMLRVQATATFKNGDFNKSLELFNAAIKKRPLDNGLMYALGTVFYDNKNYEKAAECFFKVLSNNPFHTGSHFNLGRIAILTGRKTHGMFSLGVYLSINTTDNARLVLLNNFVSNSVTDESTVTVSIPNGCEKLDQIIRSRIALDKTFKTKVDFDAAVVRQFEMFFEQLGAIRTDINDPWILHYLELYTTLKSKNLIEPFIYNLIKSSNKDEVKKWTTKNEKELNALYITANTTIKKSREMIDVAGIWGFTQKTQAWYNSSNELEAIGNKVNGLSTGRWVYLGKAATLIAEGNFVKGDKNGTWKYYYETGELKSVEDYNTGEICLYRQDGSKKERFFLKNDLTEGDVEFFYASGGLADKTPYKENKRSGKGQSYYPSGKKDLSYEYAAGDRTGEWIKHFENGRVSSMVNYKANYYDGKYTEYYPTGKLKTQGQYMEGWSTGTWKYYYPNGKVEKEGIFKDGKSIGEWKFYDKMGQISYKGSLNEKEEWDGVKTEFFDGKPHAHYTYKNDLVIKTVYLDWTGKEIGSFGNPNGNFPAKIYYWTGQLNGEGNYKKGKLDGKWTYYFPEGIKLSDYTYKDGLLSGIASEYYRNGQKRYAFVYEEGQLHGYHIEYFINGKIKEEGWYQNGMRQQQWISYYSDGSIESDRYYLNDNLVGYADDYNTDGKKGFSTYYNKASEITSVEQYNSAGEVISKPRIDNGSNVFESFFSNGKPKARSTVLEGIYSNAISRWLPDGSVYYTFPISNASRDGAYKSYHSNSQLDSEGQYSNGNREGMWTTYYCNGQVDFSGIYVGGDRDSIWTYYYPSGGIYQTATYKDDKRNGVLRLYSPDGNPLVEKFAIGGDLAAFRTIQPNGQFGEWQLFKENSTITVKYSNGVVAYEESFKNGLLNGIKRVNFTSGKPQIEFAFVNGDYSGSYKSFYTNGNPFERKEYIDDQLIGVAEFYNPDGSLLLTETYLNGVQNGKTTVYSRGQQKELIFWAGLPE